MKPRTSFAIAWSVWTLSMVALLVPFAYRLTGHRVAGLGNQSGSIAAVVTVLLFIPMFATVGAVLAAKRPTNPVGWLVSASGLCYALGTSAVLVGHFSTRWSDWLQNWVWGLGIAIPATFVLLLFPTGHLPSRRWRPISGLRFSFGTESDGGPEGGRTRVETLVPVRRQRHPAYAKPAAPHPSGATG